MLKLLLLTGSCVFAFVANGPTVSRQVQLSAYVPEGLTAKEYAAIKAKEKKQGLGKKGPRGFKSRSFNSFVEALEKGEATHLMAVDPRKVKTGEVPIEEVPYMQRGGSWDGSDLKGAALRRAKDKQKKGMYTAGRWLDSDKDYEQNKDKINSFFAPFVQKQEDVATRAKKNGISNDAQLWRDAGALSPAEIKRQRQAKININGGEKKKFFGLF